MHRLLLQPQLVRPACVDVGMLTYKV
jgi:hypothetical protein